MKKYILTMIIIGSAFSPPFLTANADWIDLAVGYAIGSSGNSSKPNGVQPIPNATVEVIAGGECDTRVISVKDVTGYRIAQTPGCNSSERIYLKTSSGEVGYIASWFGGSVLEDILTWKASMGTQPAKVVNSKPEHVTYTQTTVDGCPEG